MSGPAIPQTRTVMEAGFTLREGIDERDWTHETGPWKSLRSLVPAGEDRRG